MRFAFIDAEKAMFPVETLCNLLDVSRSGYYAWTERETSPRAVRDACLVLQIKAIHDTNRHAYGSPRVHRELVARGECVGKNRVERLMRQNGVVAKRKRRFRKTTDSNHPNPIAPNLLERDFEPAGPSLVWAGDVTYIDTDEGWGYLAVLLDLFSRRVVGWALRPHNDTALVLAALQSALNTRNPPPGLLHHSDRGSTYTSGDYRKALDQAGLVASMSRKGDCWDNAVAESFFATLRAEFVEGQRFPTRAIAQALIGDYVDNFYNPRRRHSFNDYLSPVEFELKSKVESIKS